MSRAPTADGLRPAVRSAALDFVLADAKEDGGLDVRRDSDPAFLVVQTPLTGLRDTWKQRSFGRVLGPIDTIGRFDEEIDAALRPIAERVQRCLDEQEGRSFESFEENQRVASMIHATVTKLGKALACPKPGCGKPAKLRCRQPQRSTNGVFQFEHVGDGGKQTNHGGYTTLPKLTLVEPAPDKRKRAEVTVEDVD